MMANFHPLQMPPSLLALLAVSLTLSFAPAQAAGGALLSMQTVAPVPPALLPSRQFAITAYGAVPGGGVCTASIKEVGAVA